MKRINSGVAVTTHTTVGGVYEQIVNSTGTEERFYIHAGSRLVAQVSKVGSTLTTHYAHTDLLGSIEALTVKSGTSYSIVETAGFAEFGQPRLGTWAQGNPAFTQTRQGYTGHEMDPESGLINMNARLYDPLIGRFVTADSVIPDVYDLQSLNRYSYVLNNPFGYTDPTGHVPYASGYDWNHGAGSGGTGPSLGATIVGNATGSWSGTGVPSPLPVAVPYANNVGMGLGSPLSLGMQPVAGMQGGNNEWQLDFGAAYHRADTQAWQAQMTHFPAPEFRAPGLTALHFGLDTVAATEWPIGSQVAGGLSAIWYAVKGDTVGATSAAIGIFPFFGIANDAARLGRWADTIPEGSRLSTFRYTTEGETFIRYESANPLYTRVTPGGGVTPGTYAAPVSDGIVPLADRVRVYNLPSPEIPRPNVVTLTPPPGTPIIGPRPVKGGTGSEVEFPFGY